MSAYAQPITHTRTRTGPKSNPFKHEISRYEAMFWKISINQPHTSAFRLQLATTQSLLARLEADTRYNKYLDEHKSTHFIPDSSINTLQNVLFYHTRKPNNTTPPF